MSQGPEQPDNLGDITSADWEGADDLEAELQNEIRSDIGYEDLEIENTD
jgi:hypothetical protein